MTKLLWKRRVILKILFKKVRALADIGLSISELKLNAYLRFTTTSLQKKKVLPASVESRQRATLVFKTPI